MSQMDLDGDWYGWRLKGRHLISPDRQRMTRERLVGLMWRDEMELRLAGFASRRLAEQNKRAQQYSPKIKVVIVDLADYRQNGVSAA